MRKAPRHSARFAPNLQALEGRVVLSRGLGAEPPVPISIVAPLARVDFDAQGVQVARGPIEPSAMIARRPWPFAGWSSFDLGDRGFGRPPGWSSSDGDRSSHDRASFDGHDEPEASGPPAPDPDASQASTPSASMTAPPTRGLGAMLARLGLPSPLGPQAGPGDPDSQPPRAMVPRPRGPFPPPVAIESESPAMGRGASAPAAPDAAPASVATASPDPARPLAATNMAAPATVAMLGLGTSSTSIADGPVAGGAAGPRPVPQADGPPGPAPGQAASDPRSARDAEAVEADKAGTPAEEPAPIGSGVLEAFLPLDRAAIDLALGRVLGELDDLGVPFAGPSSRLPLAFPVAAALAAAEAARRWRGRATAPGPSIARSSRFSSLRGLS